MAINLIIGILIGMLMGSGVWASETSVPDTLAPEKLQSLLQKGKFLEGQIQNRQKNADQRQDPAARQYHVGYEDGYNKAVLDLLKSQLLGDLPVAPANAAQQVPLRTSPTTAAMPPAYIDVNPDVNQVTNSVTSPITNSTSMSATMPVTELVTPTNTVAPSLVVPMIAAPALNAGTDHSTSVKEIQPAVTPVPNVAQTQENQFRQLMLQSTANIEAKNWAQAVSYASAAISVKGNSAEAYINRSWAFAEQGMFKKAMEDADTAIQLGPNNSLAYNNRAYTYDLMEDLPNAKKDYQRACDLNFKNACGVVAKINEINNNRKNRVAMLSKQSEEAIRKRDWVNLISLSSQILELDKNHASAYVNRSWAHAEQGNYKVALVDANAAIALNPKNPLAFNNRAYTYDLMGDLPKAKVDYQLACSLNLKSACAVVTKIIEIERKAARIKAVQEANAKKVSAQKISAPKPRVATKSAPESKRDNIAALISESLEKFRSGNWHAVEQISNKVLKLDPRNALAYVNRAGARTEMGLLYNAVDDTDKAIQINPKLGIAYNNKGFALERMGNFSKAAKEYQTACKLGVKQSCSDFHRLSAKVSK